MGTTHLVIPDPHAHFENNNDRADWIGNLIVEVQPDVVINLGDTACMPSLSSYDRGTRAFVGRSYAADIAAHGDFQERLWAPAKKRKKKLPRSVTLEGNHEHRIERALDMNPELAGTVGFADLQLEEWYDDIVRYNGAHPGTIEIDGITYAHYLPSGISGRPLQSVHHAFQLLQKNHSSCTVGHSHLADFYTQRGIRGERINGLVAGCAIDYDANWCGIGVNNVWWRGVVVCTNVENGDYDVQFLSMRTLRDKYSQIDA